MRLAVSALLAGRASSHFKLTPAEICAQLEGGYRAQIEKGGEPFVLMESHSKLRAMALQDLRRPAVFWERIEAKTVAVKVTPPDAVCKALTKILPRGAKAECRLLRAPKGLGSLGRRRFVAFIDWEGGRMAREAKEVVGSASVWAAGRGIRGWRKQCAPPCAAPIPITKCAAAGSCVDSGPIVAGSISTSSSTTRTSPLFFLA